MKFSSENILAGYWTTRMLILLIFGVGASIWGFNEFISQKAKNWSKTYGRLVAVQLNERTRDKQPEFFLKVSHQYLVEGIKYQLSIDQILLPGVDATELKKEIESRDSLKVIFYNSKKPDEAVYDLKEVESDNTNLIFVLVPTTIIISLIGFYGFRLGYKYLKNQ